MSGPVLIDQKLNKVLNELLALKLNFLSIERILQTKTNLSIAQKEVILKLIYINLKVKVPTHGEILRKEKKWAKIKLQQRQVIKNKPVQIKTTWLKETNSKIKKSPQIIKNKILEQAKTVVKNTSKLVTLAEKYQKRKKNPVDYMQKAKDKINNLRNSGQTYNRMGQDHVKWNPAYSNNLYGSKLKSANTSKRQLN